MGLKKIFTDVKELVGINSVDDFDENDEFENEIEEEKKEDKKPSKSIFSKKNKEKEEFKNEDFIDESENYSTVFIDPKQFDDCKKIAKYIAQEKMITINLENVSPNVAQRIMDFLAGAMEIKNANFAQIAKNVYTIVPENMKIYYEGAKRKEKKLIDLERGKDDK